MHERHRRCRQKGLRQRGQAARIRAKLVDRLAEVAREVRRSAVHAAGSAPRSTLVRPAAAGCSRWSSRPGCADCTQFELVINKIRVPRLDTGSPRRKPDNVSADEVYGNRQICRYLRRRGIRHVIPKKADQAANRVRRRRSRRPLGSDFRDFAAIEARAAHVAGELAGAESR